jgi:hypothetical protein
VNHVNPRAANIAAITRKHFASLLFLALCLIVPVRTGFPQSNTGSGLNSQTAVNPPRQSPNFGGDPGSGGFDSILAERRMKMLNNERRKSLVSDSDRLLRLATELNYEIAHSNSGSLSPDQLRKVADIEKLAHNVRDKMVMTVSSPSDSFIPINGPPFSQ